MSHCLDNCRSSILSSNDCMLAIRTDGSGSLLSRLRILRRQPNLRPLFLRLFFTQITGIWTCSRESSISFSSDALKEKASCSSWWVIAVLIARSYFWVIRDGSSNIMYKISLKNKLQTMQRNKPKKQLVRNRKTSAFFSGAIFWLCYTVHV